MADHPFGESGYCVLRQVAGTTGGLVDSSVSVAIITSGTALAVSLGGVGVNVLSATRVRRAQTMDVMARYRDPLLWAAFELRRRTYGIAAKDLLRRSLATGGRDWEYAQTNTMFVIAQYLCWVEILRRGIRFLDLGDDAQNRRLVQLIHNITGSFAAMGFTDDTLRLYRGDQRAIGESMILPAGLQDEDYECLGYAAFTRRLRSDPEFAHWFEPLRAGIAALAEADSPRTDRLAALHNQISDLVDFLDPHAVRFPSQQRDRL